MITVTSYRSTIFQLLGCCSAYVILLALDSSVKRLGGQVREPMPRIQSDVVSQMADWSWSSHLERQPVVLG